MNTGLFAFLLVECRLPDTDRVKFRLPSELPIIRAAGLVSHLQLPDYERRS